MKSPAIAFFRWAFLAITAIGATSLSGADADSAVPANMQKQEAAALVDARTCLEIRRENGQALTAAFIELQATTAQRLSEIRFQLCASDKERRAEGEDLIRYIETNIVIDGNEIHPDFPQYRQIDYHLIAAKRRATQIDKACSPTVPQTQPAEQPTVADLVLAAKGVYESLERRGGVTIDDVDLRNRYSRRWADAEREAAKDKPSRIAAYENHLRRMKELRDFWRRIGVPSVGWRRAWPISTLLRRRGL
ncbi:MAG TPA: hypothetical protein VFC46_00930 [Humisphaera sp.]|nr:hypothetical protein [Humisphaera sp.]